jgi:DNA helicase-2/ATP-dependent DNA helicase PcrA
MWIESVKMAVKGLTVEKKIRHITEHSPTRKIVTENPAIETSLNTLLHIAKSYGASTHAFLTASALQTDADTYNSTTEKVSLMTMHAAKGLEFPVVFITGCEDGFIPHNRSGTDPEEERRLFFVAMTRAKEQLYLTAAKCRRIYGEKVTRKLSPFVVDIETQLKRHETHRAKASKNKKDDRVQLKLF